MIKTSIRPIYITVYFVLVYCIVLFLKGFLSFPILFEDEHHYFPTAIEFSSSWIPSLELLKTYKQLNTPLPFLFGGWVIRLFGEDIHYLRIMNFVLSFVVVMLFVWFEWEKGNQKWWMLIPLFAMPSFYLCSVHYYTDMVAWIFVLLGLIGYLKGRDLWAAIAFAAAVSSRQYMLAFPFAVGLFEVAAIFQANNWNLKTAIKETIKKPVWLFYAAAVLSLIPWVLLWNGPAPPALLKVQHYGSGPIYNVGFVVYTLACVAFYFVIPETLIKRNWGYFLNYISLHQRFLMAIVAVIAVLVLIFPPQQTHNPYFTWPYLGYLDQGLELIRISGWFKNLLYIILASITLVRFMKPGVISLSGFFVGVNVLLLGNAQLSWDKYLFPTLMILWFLEMHQQDKAVRAAKI